MKKMLLVVAIFFLSWGAFAQSTKVVTDSVVFRVENVKVFEGVTKNGNPKWWIELPSAGGVKKVSMTESHVKSGRLLALIERRDESTGKYYYSVKFAESKRGSSGAKADLSGLK